MPSSRYRTSRSASPHPRLRRDLSASLLKRRSKLKPIDIFEAWLEENGAAVRQLDTVIAEMRLRPEIDFATLSVAAQELRRLAGG